MTESDGTVAAMFPQEARLRNLTFVQFSVFLTKLALTSSLFETPQLLCAALRRHEEGCLQGPIGRGPRGSGLGAPERRGRGAEDLHREGESHDATFKRLRPSLTPRRLRSDPYYASIKLLSAARPRG